MQSSKNEFDFFRYAMCVIFAIVADLSTMAGLFFCVIIAVGVNLLDLNFGFYAIPLLMYVAYLLVRGYGHYLLSKGGVDERFAARKKHPIITYGINN